MSSIERREPGKDGLPSVKSDEHKTVRESSSCCETKRTPPPKGKKKGVQQGSKPT